MAKRIAIIEGRGGVAGKTNADVFRRQGYDIHAYGTRLEALNGMRERLPDLAIIDIGLGDEAEGGFDLCRELRALSDTVPIIFLTARDSDLDTISGFRLGADDYLTKDISLPHLLARVAALFRRQEAMKNPDTHREYLERGLLILDVDPDDH